MSSVTAISFEADAIRIVSGTFSNDIFTPKQSQTLHESDLDAFLASDQASSYLVTINPGDAVYETVTIPPVDSKLTSVLARNEAARLHPEIKEFSCAFQVIGDIPVEGRTIRKVACCMVPHSDITPILEIFIRNNKVVQHMTLTAFALVPMLDQLDEQERSGALLCAFDGGVSKMLFLTDNGAVIFSRQVSSNEHGWDLYDRQNVTMTLDYCFQTLRMRPGKVIALNLKDAENEAGQPLPRLTPVPFPSCIHADQELLLDYTVPLMLAAVPQTTATNLLPGPYSDEIGKQNLMRKTALVFLAGSLIMLIMLSIKFMSMRTVMEDIAGLKLQESNLSALYQAHQQARKERDADQPLITAMNGILLPSDIPRLLVAFDAVKTFGVTVTSLNAARGADSITLQLAGAMSATSFAAAQSQFESFIATLQKLPGISVTARQIDQTKKTFSIGATYKP